MDPHEKIRAAARPGWYADSLQGAPGIAREFPAAGVGLAAFVGAYVGSANDIFEIHVGHYDDPGSATAEDLREIGLQLIAIADAMSPSAMPDTSPEGSR